MAIMAASMGYMFVGMQLLMSMPRHSQQLARQQSSASGPARYEPGSNTAARAPELAAKEPPRPSVETPQAASAETYTIIAGNSLGRIAARFYGDARRWPSIMKANPGLHPRQLRAGQVIKLPGRRRLGRNDRARVFLVCVLSEDETSVHFRRKHFRRLLAPVVRQFEFPVRANCRRSRQKQSGLSASPIKSHNGGLCDRK